MKYLISSLFLLTVWLIDGCFCQVFSQNKEYWQQKCDYRIQVTLDDTNHLLEAFLELDYQNNSPDTLKYIYFHLWPNAFKNTETAFAQQKVENGSLRFHYALPSTKGNIDGMAFKVEGKGVSLELDKDNIDIGKITLNQPLLPGKKIQIETPFSVKIPDSYSRLGHVNQSYQITQWYPKPAVYDKNGWNPMPYLDQGEFYSEYGSFDVEITLPKNYVVGATGDLQNEEELEFLNQKALETAKIDSFKSTKNEFPDSDSGFKTLHYTQKNIHDFAWFADKRFHVLKKEFTLPNTKRKITAWAMFTNSEANMWKECPNYLQGAIEHYSEKVGEYPYNQVTAVQSALSAGAGMEYPNVTVIGLSGSEYGLENVIVHEVGHNWFYGQLGSNEREHPWMDEGINSYYEQRYFTERYPNLKLSESLLAGVPPFLIKGLGATEKTLRDGYEIIYQFLARKRDDQHIGEHSCKFTNGNYGAIAYGKSILAFNYLEAYLGTKELDRIMQEYYRQYEFKHPQPEDLRQVFEDESKKPLDWFFDDLIGTRKPVDYWLYKFKKEGQTIGNDKFDLVTVRNHPRNIQGPFSLTALKEDKPVHRIWYDGFMGQEEVLFPSMEYDKLVLDYDNQLPEYNRRNNTIKRDGLFKKSGGVNVHLLPKLETADRSQLFVTPIVGVNTFDGFMAGLAIYNDLLPSRNLSYTFAPMYAFDSQKLTGTGEINYDWYPDIFSFIKRVGFNLHGKSFGYATDRVGVDNDPISLSYYRVAPKITFEFKEKEARSSKKKELSFRHIQLFSDKAADTEIYRPFKYVEQEYFNELSFDFSNTQVLKPHSFNLTLQQGKEHLLASGEFRYKSVFNSSRQAFSIRLYAGGFIENNTTNNPIRLGLSGQSLYDYTHEYMYIGRNAISDLASRQLYPIQGNFKVVSSRGRTQEWLGAINLESDFPFLPKLPFKAFADFGISADEENLYSDGEITVLYDMGLALSLLNNNISVYVPLLYSDVFKQGNALKWYERITFLINFNQMNPIRLVREAKI